MVERSNRVIAVYDGREKGGTVGTIRLVHTTKVSTVISPEITHSFNTVADGASEPMPAENIQNYLDARHQLYAKTWTLRQTSLPKCFKCQTVICALCVPFRALRQTKKPRHGRS